MHTEAVEFIVSCAFCHGCFGRGHTEEQAIISAKASGVDQITVSGPTGLISLNACSHSAELTIARHIDWAQS
jgi:hypothetical protein